MKLFRVAPPASTARNVVTTLLQTTVFWGTFLWLIPWAIHAMTTSMALAPTPFAGHRALGITLFALAGTLGLSTGMWMAVCGEGTPLPLQTARRFVTVGPYRYVRNPMAIAGIAQGVAVGLFLADGFVVAYALAGAAVWHFLARPPEEADLEARFGDAYRHYRATVPLWLPRWRRATTTRRATGHE